MYCNESPVNCNESLLNSEATLNKLNSISIPYSIHQASVILFLYYLFLFRDLLYMLAEKQQNRKQKHADLQYDSLAFSSQTD